MPDKITYRQLNSAVTGFAKRVSRGSEAIKGESLVISDAAVDTARTAEGIAGMGIDPDTVAETRGLARLMDGLSASATAYVSTADTTARAAQAAHDQNRDSHQGIAEAFNRSPVDLSAVNRTWFAQE
ncbi:hypothetical protein HY68_37005 [Streptomyces sp. AcH 505]|uniref:hypothetical protein n=1 Tax=Streptomyces sp. AcH 505 TaxID=352211 RepID=UPI0005918E60|nr:hypothetical protein HY68_37005 [Streptomyces sp. AcH 505]